MSWNFRFVGVTTRDEDDESAAELAAKTSSLDQDGISTAEIDAINIHDAMEAAEFEDSLPVVEAGNNPNIGSARAENTNAPKEKISKIQVPGFGMVPIGKALNLALKGHGQSGRSVAPAKLEAGRVARSRGQKAAGTGGDARVPDDVDSDGVIAFEDPLLIVVKHEIGVVPVVFLPEEFDTKTRKGVTGISQEDFEDEGTLATGRVLGLTPIEADVLQWTVGTMYGAVVISPTVNACTILPTTVTEGDTSTWRFGIDALVSAGDLLLGKVTSNPSKKPGLLSLKSSMLPYVLLSGDTVSLSVPAACDITDSSVSGNKVVTCGVPGCGMKFNLKHARQHAGFHLICETPKVVSSDTPLCGLCAVHPQAPFTNDTSNSSCPCWLEKTTGGRVLKAKIYCASYGKGPDYSQKSALKATKTAPSTNTVLMCPLCPQKPMPFYGWKYNFHLHFKKVHPSHPIPSEFAEQLKINDEERAWLRNFRTPKLAEHSRKTTSNSTCVIPPVGSVSMPMPSTDKDNSACVLPRVAVSSLSSSSDSAFSLEGNGSQIGQGESKCSGISRDDGGASTSLPAADVTPQGRR